MDTKFLFERDICLFSLFAMGFKNVTQKFCFNPKSGKKVIQPWSKGWFRMYLVLVNVFPTISDSVKLPFIQNLFSFEINLFSLGWPFYTWCIHYSFESYKNTFITPAWRIEIRIQLKLYFILLYLISLLYFQQKVSNFDIESPCHILNFFFLKLQLNWAQCIHWL